MKLVTPPYTLRYSKKAKYLQLRMSSQGLEVIAPVNLQEKAGQQIIQQFLTQKQKWIQKQWQETYRLEDAANKFDFIQPRLPSDINLIALNQQWRVVYLASKTPELKLLTNPQHKITLIGEIQNELLCLSKLREWLQKIAKQYLPFYLEEISKEVGLPFNKVSIRNNTTRWGSCSQKKNISLCCKLLFLPFPLVRHILLHELCHTKLMNHGKKFWQMLSRFDENTEQHVEMLKRIQIPGWV